MSWRHRIPARRPVGVVVLATALALAPVAACSTPDDGGGGSSGPTSQPAVRPTTASTPTARPTDEPSGRSPSLTLGQKVGQLFMTGAEANGAPAASLDAISRHHVGNVMLTGRSTKGVDATADVVRDLEAAVTTSSTGGIRLFVATDQEGGLVQVLRGPGFTRIPDALSQAQMAPERLRVAARSWGRELRKARVTMNLAPVLDTVPSPAFAPRNAPIGAFRREYGFEPRTVARHGVAFVQGMADAGVATSIKHFPGLGRVRANPDVSSDVTDRATTVDDPYLEPFRAGIEAGTPLVMVSTAFYPRIDPDHPAAFSQRTIEGLLRERLGFRGVVISDDLSNAQQVAQWSPGRRAVQFLQAGGDIVLAVDPQDMPAMVGAVLAKARTSPAFAAKVDSALARVLTAKRRLLADR